MKTLDLQGPEQMQDGAGAAAMVLGAAQSPLTSAAWMAEISSVFWL